MNFDDYRNNEPYPDIYAKKREITDEINAEKLTAEERKAKLADVSRVATAWFHEAVQPYNDRQREIDRQFWADCREDIGYDEFLNEEGCKALEGYAWQEGHSSGYSEVYGYLCEMADLARKLVESAKPPSCGEF